MLPSASAQTRYAGSPDQPCPNLQYLPQENIPGLLRCLLLALRVRHLRQLLVYSCYRRQRKCLIIINQKVILGRLLCRSADYSAGRHGFVPFLEAVHRLYCVEMDIDVLHIDRLLDSQLLLLHEPMLDSVPEVQCLHHCRELVLSQLGAAQHFQQVVGRGLT